MKRSASVKVGGGYLYEQDGPDDVGLDQLFEVKSAVPWTMNSETMAVGPHLFRSNAGAPIRIVFPSNWQICQIELLVKFVKFTKIWQHLEGSFSTVSKPPLASKLKKSRVFKI